MSKLQFPESDLEQITERVVKVAPPDPKDVMRFNACRWLNRLFYDVRRWNLKFIAFLRTYPGFEKSRDLEHYRHFFKRLEEYRRGLDRRYGDPKGDLCADLKMLSARFTLDFNWLFKQDATAYDEVYRIVCDAYSSENSVLERAVGLINDVIAKDNVRYANDVEKEIDTTEFLTWHIDHHMEVVKIILDYEKGSAEAVKRLNEIADSAGFKLLDVNDYAKGLADPMRNPQTMLMGEQIITENKTVRSNQMTRQTERLNMILAFSFGVLFVAAILALIVLIPNPSRVQYHFFTIIIALAAGGVATVISGMLNVRVSFGQRLAIGATGALAVFVLVYFFLPAMTTAK